MKIRAPRCPACASELVLTAHGELDTWVCPSGHGLAMTLNEAHGRLQNDEVAQLWQKARAAAPPAAARACPMCSAPMAAIELTYDDDEVAEGTMGDGHDLGSEWVDVCESCQVIWFDDGELESFPLDLPDRAPSQAELDQVAQITNRFGQDFVQARADEESRQLTERIYRRIARRPQLLRALEEVGSLGRA